MPPPLTHSDLLPRLDLLAWRAGDLRRGRAALREAEGLAAQSPEDAEVQDLLALARQAHADARQRQQDKALWVITPLISSLLLTAALLSLAGLLGPGEARLPVLTTASPSPGAERVAVLSLGQDLGIDAETTAEPPSRTTDTIDRPPSPTEEEPQADLDPASPDPAPVEALPDQATEEIVVDTPPPPVVPSVVRPTPAAASLALPRGEPSPRSTPEAGGRAGGGSQSSGRPGGEGFTALQGLAPMRFLELGDPAPGRRSARPGVFIAHTEVSQKQWVALMGLDLGSVSGHWDHPAEAMTWCQAVRFANALSKHEKLRPAYKVSKDCETGGSVQWDQQAEGFRLLTEDEWDALADGGQAMGEAGGKAAQINNRGLGRVSLGADDQQHGLLGLRDNAREWVWGAQEHRSLACGCAPGQAEPCRLEVGPAEVPLGVGLRLARGAP